MILEEFVCPDVLSRVLACEILCSIAKGSSQVRLMIFSNANLFSLLLSSSKDEILTAKTCSLFRVLLLCKESGQYEDRIALISNTFVDYLVGDDRSEGVVIVDLLGIQPVTPIKIQIENNVILTEVLSTLATLAQSDKNRAVFIHRAELQRHINNVLIYFSNPKNEFLEVYNLVLAECLRLIANLYFNEKCRNYFESHHIAENLLSLLINQKINQTLRIQTLILIRKTIDVSDSNKDAIILNYGIVNFISLLSNTNNVVVFQALSILNTFCHKDSFLEVIRANLSQATLLSLQSRGEIISHVSSELLNFLGFGF